MGTEARTGVIFIFRVCPEPRHEIARAETTLHLALARRDQAMLSDRDRLAAVAALVEAAHALRPDVLTPQAASAEISPARRVNGRG